MVHGKIYEQKPAALLAASNLGANRIGYRRRLHEGTILRASFQLTEPGPRYPTAVLEANHFWTPDLGLKHSTRISCSMDKLSA